MNTVLLVKYIIKMRNKVNISYVNAGYIFDKDSFSSV
ncbi:hypothetical protein EV215_2084 [Hypnocyclicus thermotrophus]|uniref:Uncharacterized protein n=1 Tax=Hypnocyclicus thermotrophus TaxID=1627895 RepID=A0AA46DWW0_9FUSO|nr:hypothetical protein EV215_2084 [Hypnocyclicus thermotrophus]